MRTVLAVIALTSACCLVRPAPVLASGAGIGALSVLATTPAFLPVAASPDSEPGPPPNPDDPYIKSFYTCSLLACDTLICPSDSFLVTIQGVFPDDCHIIRRIELIYPPVPLNERVAPPPVVVVLVDDRGCLGRPCVIGYFSWVARIALPPMPAGIHPLTVAVAEVTCADTLPPPPWRETHQGYVVVSSQCDSVPPPNGQCLLTDWVHTGTTECDATIGPGQVASLTHAVRSPVALAGLEGSFNLWPYNLRIVNIETTGPAVGMHLTWTATATGAQFVMFADHGAPIPPALDSDPSVPVLIVSVAPKPGQSIPPVSYLSAGYMLGATEVGQGVPACPIMYTSIRDPAARICAAPQCDFNLDGLTDVRDLVLMVRCLFSPTRCATFDCNQDGGFSLDDVLCCARHILHPNPCPIPEGCPPDTTTPRPMKDVGLSVGMPIDAGEAIRVPIQFQGDALLGAAKLVFPFPSDRYRLQGIVASNPAWLALAAVEQGSIVAALIRTGPDIEAAPPRPLEVTLTLTPVEVGEGGGELGTLRGEFSDTEGAPVLISMNAPVRPLPGGAQVQLSENRPDPFTGETRFTVTLPRAGNLELGVFDLNGRRITSLHDGPLTAGSTEFSWNGRTASGGRAASGVYFYQAVVDGRAVSRKMVLLGE